MKIEIEIITTKKKLSKSIVRQLRTANTGDFNHAINVSKIGYHIRNLGTGYAPKVAILEGINGWCVVNIRDWVSIKGRPIVTAKSFNGKGSLIKTFDSFEQRERWLCHYNEVKKLCEKNQLFL